MERFEIYEDIKKRTNGDIYIGVVGPVRSGKSMFISRFMQNLVIPNIKNEQQKERAIDELPQSAEGKTIMTTQPKFVPENAVNVHIDDVDLSVRLVDCVGYLVSGAMGHEEGDKPRLVKTPWSEKEIPFEEAAEIGTEKVITEHSTIGVAITTDGSISDLPRSSYVDAEQKVVDELKKTGKPFVLVVNSKTPQSQDTQNLAKSLEKKYGVSTLAINVKELSEKDIEQIFEKVLLEFPIRSLKVTMPDWLRALDGDDEIITTIINEVKKFGEGAEKIGQIDKTNVAFLESEDFEPLTIGSIKMGEGTIMFDIKPRQQLFYKVLSNQCGTKIQDDYHLVRYIKELAFAKTQYDKLASALEQVDENGYGVVIPKLDSMVLEAPQIVKQGGRFGVKIKATAPSLHIMKVDVETEVNPLVGTEEQTKDLAQYLQDEFETNPDAVWQTNMFGKTLETLVSEGIQDKLTAMPLEAQRKMRKTVGRIVNEGRGGIICILL